MRVRLLAPHIIRDEWMPAKTEVDILPSGVTPLMEGLDEEAIESIKKENLRVYGRYENTPPGWEPPLGPIVDDPPIKRPLEENQPVYHFVGRKEYIS